MSERKEAKVGMGNVAINLNGSEHYLVPSLNAMQTLSRFGGGNGLRGVVDSVAKMDLDSVVRVVQLGLGPNAVKELGGAQKLPSLIYEAGMADSTGGIIAKCIEYLSNLMNGGRPLEPIDDDEKETADHPH